MKKQWPIFLLAFALPTLAVLWWWGLFATAKIEIVQRGPYRYAYLTAEGPYSRLAAKRAEVEAELRRQGIAAQGAATLIFDDPRTTPTDRRRARTGFLIADEAAPAPPLAMDAIPPRRVLSASIKAHPVFAYGKAYGALLDYTRQHGMPLHLPTLEIYDASVLTVEMPLEPKP